MLKKLTEDKIAEILETGIIEFSRLGLDRANTNEIAKKAGISVGVLFKYWKDKEAFFLACVDRSLAVLESVLAEALSRDEKILVRAERMIRAVQKTSREHVNYINLYNEITAGASKKYARVLAEKIEGITARTYSALIAEAQAEGILRADADPRMFAFFFDNLLMMMQFSYSCEYYNERFKIYCGEDVLDQDERVVSQLLLFLESAFTFTRAEVPHGKG